MTASSEPLTWEWDTDSYAAEKCMSPSSEVARFASDSASSG
jgi:hypothetical protein